MAELSPVYRLAMNVVTPAIKTWGRMEVSGLEHLPPSGPVLLAGNHDSYWDPLAIGLAAKDVRQIHALAKKELWSFPGLGPVLNGMGQIPIDRGKGDARALDAAVERLRQGACIGIFLEGTRSLGRTLRARSGFYRLAERVPEAELVSVSVTGTTDLPRFPSPRPHVKVRFFRPAYSTRGDDLTRRMLEEIRAEAPISATGRTPERQRRLREKKEKEKAKA
jgi:1-acyl-sn-glycerol-3-phosphate acyltransferase